MIGSRGEIANIIIGDKDVAIGVGGLVEIGTVGGELEIGISNGGR